MECDPPFRGCCGPAPDPQIWTDWLGIPVYDLAILPMRQNTTVLYELLVTSSLQKYKNATFKTEVRSRERPLSAIKSCLCQHTQTTHLHRKPNSWKMENCSIDNMTTKIAIFGVFYPSIVGCTCVLNARCKNVNVQTDRQIRFVPLVLSFLHNP